MRILELFAGTGSVGKAAEELGFEVISLDITDRFSKIDILVNIFEWDYTCYQPKHFDIVWASPPCSSFSALQNCLIRTGKGGITREQLENRIYKEGLPLLMKALEIITYLQPKYYFIENPQTGRMKDFLKLPFVDLDYCKFGYVYRKRTRFWTNVPNLETHKCCKKSPCEARGNNTKHPKTIGSKIKNPGLSLADRYSIPHKLVLYLLKSCI